MVAAAIIEEAAEVVKVAAATAIKVEESVEAASVLKLTTVITNTMGQEKEFAITGVVMVRNSSKEKGSEHSKFLTITDNSL